MEVTLYKNFSKRKNSTKQPLGVESVTKNLTLKGECDYIHPSFFLADVEGYVYLKAWNNYYFINGVAYDINGAQYITCNIDVLATWKAQILATTAYVQYSSSDYDENIIDDRISQKVTKVFDTIAEESIFVQNHTGGCICIMAANSIQGSKAWILSLSNFDELVSLLIQAGTSAWQSLKELFGDAVGSIIGARYIPISYDYFYDTYFDNYRDDILLGDFSTGVGGIFFDGYVKDVVDIDIPRRYNDFRRCSEYTSYRLCLPFVGIVEISPENLIGYNKLKINYSMNCATGALSYAIWTDVGVGETVKLLGMYNGEFGRQIPIATDQINAIGVLGGTVTAGTALYSGVAKNIAAPLAMGGYGGGALAVASVLAGIATATISANKQDFTIVGGYGGGFAESVLSSFYLQEVSNDTVQEPSDMTELYGRPCMKVRTLTGLTGYVQCIGFAVNISALDEVRNIINTALDNGIYIE